MNWTESLDQYCERLDASFWAEPINAVTNAAFLVAAALALRIWLRQTPRDWSALALILVVAATGIGSFLFHTFANRWSLLSDVIPIAIFIHLYLFLALRRFLTAPVIVAGGTTALFLVASPFIGRLAAPLVGSSAGYLPALAAIFVVGALCLRRSRETALGLFVTGGVFALSLTFRTLDGPLCGLLPFGTHFLWHLLNATVLFLLLALYLKAGAALRR
ncbi:hypothetical protein GWI72_11680 [Microvirga tunisiensis]|uniref:Uncharacterized protein n=2 Tax=Pannonibacter tanglangensis TaxID=2750084 RepID=A0ABW9ZN02_9HYPH|nr:MULTISPECIES: ceramidase domain-containing protein [unclassified Pannonibacter]NBN64394.1 hypothetical protein [Pannonibacter sp. XCT-34]NBN78927.1 hypothetical protein [Pannonibacter sp. XCT-53]